MKENEPVIESEGKWLLDVFMSFCNYCPACRGPHEVHINQNNASIHMDGQDLPLRRTRWADCVRSRNSKNPFAPLGMDRRGLKTGAVTEVGLENSPEVSAGWDSRGKPGEGAEDETA